MFSLCFLLMHFKPSLQDEWRWKGSIQAVPCPSVAAQVRVCRLFCRIIRMGVHFFLGGKQDLWDQGLLLSWRPPQCPLEIQLLITDIKLPALGRILQTLRKDFEYLCRSLCLLHVLGHGCCFWVYLLFVKNTFQVGTFVVSFLWLHPMLSSLVFSIAIDASESRIS